VRGNWGGAGRLREERKGPSKKKGGESPHIITVWGSKKSLYDGMPTKKKTFRRDSAEKKERCKVRRGEDVSFFGERKKKG